MSASELADWWDEQKAETEKILSDWVMDNPQWWTVAIAGTIQTSMDLGAGMVDVLRFGEGMAEGGIKGVGMDVLRLLMLLGPLGKAGSAASRVLTPLIKSGNLRFAVQVAGVDGPCTFQAVNNALSISKGRNIFVTVDDMAGAVGKRLTQLAKNPGGDYELAAWVDELVPFLRQVGVRTKAVGGFSKVDEVIALAQRETGPVIFAIRSTVRTAAGVTEEILHSVIAMRTPGGSVRFADYGGRFVRSLRDILTQWGTPISEIELLQSGSSATIIEGAILTGEYAKKLAQGAVLIMEGIAAIETYTNGVEMAVPAMVVATPTPTSKGEAPVDPEILKGSFGAYKSRANGRPVIRLPEIVISAGRRAAPRSDYLTGVQFRLNALGFCSGQVDGIFGPITRKAVIAFQRAYPPLRPDGIPGPKTQKRLCEVCGY